MLLGDIGGAIRVVDRRLYHLLRPLLRKVREKHEK